LEIAGLKGTWEQTRNAAVVLYSATIMATIIPGFVHIPSPIVIFYYFLVPGYFVMLLLRETGTLLERLFYSVVWSLAIVVSDFSIKSIYGLGYTDLPTSLIIPAITLVLMAYDHFHGR
jgi:hypothetical protein